MPRRNSRTDIIQAAAELAAERSLARITLKEVAERAGIRPTSLYRHFSQAGDLFDEVLSLALVEIEAAGRAYLGTASPAVIVKTAVFEMTVNSLRGDLHRRLLQHALAEEDVGTLRKIMDARRPDILRFSKILGEVSNGQDPFLLHFAIVALATGYVQFKPYFDLIDPEHNLDLEPEALANTVLGWLLPDIDWPNIAIMHREKEAATESN